MTSQYLDNLWTGEQLSRLAKIYLGASKETLLAEFPGRSISRIRAVASYHNLRRSCTWTREELSKLKEVFLSASEEMLAAEFPGRSTKAIREKARRLGLKTDYSWTAFEDRQLRERYQLNDPKDEPIGERSASACLQRAYKLGLHKKKYQTMTHQHHLEDWQHDVANGDTLLGLNDWIKANINDEEDDGWNENVSA